VLTVRAISEQTANIETRAETIRFFQRASHLQIMRVLAPPGKIECDKASDRSLSQSCQWVGMTYGLGRDFSVFGGLGWVLYSKSTKNLKGLR